MNSRLKNKVILLISLTLFVLILLGFYIINTEELAHKILGSVTVFIVLAMVTNEELKQIMVQLNIPNKDGKWIQKFTKID